MCLLDDPKKHVFYFFFVFVQLFYLLYAPILDLFDKNYFAFNIFIGYDAYEKGIGILSAHIFFYNVGYFVFSSWKKKQVILSSEDQEKRIKRFRIIFYILFIAVLINAFSGKINLVEVLTGKSNQSTLGLEGKTFWVANFADSLIILLIASFYFQEKKKHKLVYFILTIPLFLLLGFRYRILLTIFGILFYSIHRSTLNAMSIVKYIFVTVCLFFLFMFISENRIAFYTQKIEELNFDITKYNYSSIYENSVGSIVDFAVYRALENNVVKHDFGESMFRYPFIMIIPASFFENGVKPYPAPQINAIDMSMNVTRVYGQAVTFNGMCYFAFGLPGVIIFSFLLGMIIKKVELTGFPDSLFIIKTIWVLAIFQLYTRGYLGQFLLHLAYFFIPAYLLKKRKKKNGQWHSK